MRRALVVLVGTAGVVLGLSACGGSSDQPPATQQAESPQQELAQIGSTLDAIDGELAGDGSP